MASTCYRNPDIDILSVDSAASLFDFGVYGLQHNDTEGRSTCPPHPVSVRNYPPMYYSYIKARYR